MTTIDAIHAADDEPKRSRIGAALAKGYVFGAVLLAALAPLIANGRPLTMIGEDGERIWPVFRALTRADAFWLAGAAFLPGATVIGLLLARFGRSPAPARRNRIRAALYAVLIAVLCGGAFRHRPIHDARAYLRETAARATLDEIARAAAAKIGDVERTATAAAALSDLRRDATAMLDLQKDLDRFLEALRAGDAGAGLRLEIDRNKRVLSSLESAIYPVFRAGPDALDGGRRRAPPFASALHPLGTDESGRDILARLVHGARTSLFVAFGAVFLAIILGTAIGAAAALGGPLVDRTLTSVNLTVMCLPVLSILLVLLAYLPQRSDVLILILASLLWVQPARLVRAELRRRLAEDFVLAWRALGASESRIFFRHLLPFLGPPLFVHASLAIGAVVLAESSLEFLGLGVYGAPSWGGLLADARRDLSGLKHVAFLAGGALFFLVLSFNAIADDLAAANKDE